MTRGWTEDEMGDTCPRILYMLVLAVIPSAIGLCVVPLLAWSVPWTSSFGTTSGPSHEWVVMRMAVALAVVVASTVWMWRATGRRAGRAFLWSVFWGILGWCMTAVLCRAAQASSFLAEYGPILVGTAVFGGTLAVLIGQRMKTYPQACSAAMLSGLLAFALLAFVVGAAYVSWGKTEFKDYPEDFSSQRTPDERSGRSPSTVATASRHSSPVTRHPGETNTAPPLS